MSRAGTSSTCTVLFIISDVLTTLVIHFKCSLLTLRGREKGKMGRPWSHLPPRRVELQRRRRRLRRPCHPRSAQVGTWRQALATRALNAVKRHCPHHF
ncbi:hypothetical protein B0H13DRAFT_2542787, partial [Mycena leptocephala]